MGYLVKNTARTTLSAPALAGDGVLTVTNPAAFPTPSSLALTGTVTTSGHTVTGVGTLFLTEVTRGDPVWAVIGGQVELRYVVYIVSNTVALIDRAFSTDIALGATLYLGTPVLLTVVEGIAYKEHVACYGVSGSDLQVIRAQDQLAASGFSAGAVVELRVTKGYLDDLPDRAVWDVFALLADAVMSQAVNVAVTGVAATTLAGALQEIFDTVSAHIADPTDAHDADAISFSQGGWAATDVKAAILEALSDALSALSAHAGAVVAHDAAQIEFAPYGPLASTDVQAAIEELADIASTSGVEKIRDVVLTSGLLWNAVDDNLLSEAIARYVHFADFYTDSGAANTLVLTPLGTYRVPGAYTDGMRVRCRINATNTGATTINVGGIGLANVVRQDGTALKKWDLIAGEEVELTYSGALAAFVRAGVWSGQVLYTASYSSQAADTDGNVSDSVSHTVQYPGATIITTATTTAYVSTFSGTGNLYGLDATLTTHGDVIDGSSQQGVGGTNKLSVTLTSIKTATNIAAGTRTVSMTAGVSFNPTLTSCDIVADIFAQFTEVRP